MHRPLTLIILVPLIILFMLITGKPFLVLGGFIFALLLYLLFWRSLPPEKRCGWGYKSSVETKEESSSRNSSGYDWLRNDWRDDPGHRYRIDNIYHRINE